eukprot:1194726-Pyramimonas_sp.AAC.1
MRKALRQSFGRASAVLPGFQADFACALCRAPRIVNGFCEVSSVPRIVSGGLPEVPVPHSALRLLS